MNLWYLKTTIVTIFLFQFVKDGYSDVVLNATCQTPNNETGICISIESCPSLKSSQIRLQNQNEIEEQAIFLNSSTCGYDPTTNERIVCCPNKSTISETDVYKNNTRERVKKIRIRLPDPPECGYPENDKLSRIVGGFPVSKGQFPWMVLIYYNRISNQYNYGDYKFTPDCSGSLITSKHVLTAAHCIHEQPIHHVKIGILNSRNETPYLYGNIVKFHMHEKYQEKPMVHDIAVLKIEWIDPSTDEIVKFIPSSVAKFICLPKVKEFRTDSYEHYSPFIAGWGFQEWNNSESRSTTLMGVQTRITKHSKCKNIYRNFKRIDVTQNVICAGYDAGEHDGCQGDSGGPLMLPIKGDDGLYYYYQIGITSTGHRCAVPGAPGVYTRVGNYIEWILWSINKVVK